MATRTDFLSNFASTSEAMEFEEQALSIGTEFLPQCAIDVRDKLTEEPASEYWAFLISQLKH